MAPPRTPMSPSSWEADALSLYQRLLPASFWEPLQKRPDRRQNNRLYNFLVVMWLLIAQRLHRLASLETARAGNCRPATPGLTIKRGRGCRSTWWNEAATVSSNS